MNPIEITQFWNWFSGNRDKYEILDYSDELINEIDKKVTSLGDFAWEIGPGGTKDHQFIISPAGNQELLVATKEIVSLAPLLNSWEFHPAKPAKLWTPVFFLETSQGEIKIDASEWQYILFKYDDGLLEIIIYTNDLRHLNEEDKTTAAEILVEGMLGEENRISHVYEINVQEYIEDDIQGKLSDIRDLPSHFDRIVHENAAN